MLDTCPLATSEVVPKKNWFHLNILGNDNWPFSLEKEAKENWIVSGLNIAIWGL